MTRRGLILDIDNTLYNWIGSFGPAFRSMVHKLAEELNEPEERLLMDFREVFRKYGTVEYPHASKELRLWSEPRMASVDWERAVSVAEKVFSITYRRRLALFPGVVSVLRWAKAEGIVVIGLSDALERWVCYRLRALGIERFFDGLYTWERAAWFADRQPVVSAIPIRMTLSDGQLKPNEEVVRRVLSDFGLSAQSTYLVGDSVAKDITAARQAGVVDVWAKYGTLHEERDIATLRAITPWPLASREDAGMALDAIVPTHTIDHFDQLIAIIGSERLTLF